LGAAYFYHLTRRPLNQTLHTLLGKARQAGWQVVVRGRTDLLLKSLDDHLWTISVDGFLPHGRAGGDHDAAQPILLSTSMDRPNDAQCVISVEGAEVLAAEVVKLERVCILFDGHDTSSVQQAREQWKTLTSAGCAAQYWSEESGQWTKQAETG
jgi:DNA polymerase-3 subunit chi